LISFEVSDRLSEAAEEWAEARLEDHDEALETKVEQALLEVEHLASGAHEVDFEVDGGTVRHDPTDELAAFLEQQAEEKGIDESDVLELHVDLFARVFLDDQNRPSNAPPT
jgi:hypothetical protein